MLFTALLTLGQAQIELKPDMVIDRTMVVAPKVYAFPNKDNEAKTGAITIKGNNITIDFAGATLEGSEQAIDPDKREGTGVIVEGNNITIKNLKVRGYKVGLIARNSKGLRLLSCDMSYNWKQHLLSTLDREDGADWMSYHQNEKDEWLRYGAGIYLSGCDSVEVKACRIVGGQNGLMMTKCNKGLVWNNTFSFLSSLGIGMYRSSDNRVMHNNVDWCVRGYSHGKWNRGQDSAGILIYEQSNNNTFAYNSVTHGGDGFFLWAGETTMKDASGGCNDNLLYGNDFSHAPTNGIEATFSRNKMINNLIMECWHGCWLGYSYNTDVLANVFAHNAESIAWEHGQDNTIGANMFYRDTMGVNLWQNKTQDPNWGYPKHRDTRSRDILIRQNEFQHIPNVAINLRDTMNAKTLSNVFVAVGEILKQTGEVPGLEFHRNTMFMLDTPAVPAGTDNKVSLGAINRSMPATMRPDGNVIDSGGADYQKRFDVLWSPYPDDTHTRGNDNDAWLRIYNTERKRYAVKPLEGGKRPFLEDRLRGRRYILVDEWGPYDFKRPILWLRKEEGATMEFEILGPKGNWKVVEVKGGTLSAQTGEVPGKVTFRPQQGNIDIRLEYTGAEVVDVRGQVSPAGKPTAFGFSKFNLPIDWTVNFYKWDASKVADPKAAMPPLSELDLGNPVKTLNTTKLDFASGGAFVEGAPDNHFATIATGTFTIQDAGDYVFNLTTDDGCRVWVNDKLVISDAWKYQGPTAYKAELTLSAGAHKIRIEHYEIDGYAALKASFAPKGP
jgi:hypothetical protein